MSELHARVARLMRYATFARRSLMPAVGMFVKNVGGPRLAWAPEVGKLALQGAGGLQRLHDAIKEESWWRNVVDIFFKGVRVSS